MFAGMVLGSAAGLPCQGVGPDTLKSRYGQKPLDYPHGTFAHGYPVDDWSADFDYALLTLRALCGPPEDDPTLTLAKLLAKWRRQGFEELGDEEGTGCDATIAYCCDDPDFLDNPPAYSATARCDKTTVAALPRALCAAILPEPVPKVAALCQITHNNSQAVAASIFTAFVIRAVLAGREVVPELVRGPVNESKRFLPSESVQRQFVQRIMEKNPGLGDRDQRNHIYRGLESLMWAYRAVLREMRELRAGNEQRSPSQFFKDVVLEVAMEGGNTASNCAMAGAFLGAVLGYTRLPEEWLGALPNRDFMEKEIGTYVATFGLN
jgi:ADP-ribosylglycohydrolase